MSYGYGPPPGQWDGYGYSQQPSPTGYPSQAAAPSYGHYPPPPAHYDYPAAPYQHPQHYPPPVHHDPHALHPPPDVASDPNSFRRFFLTTLQSLNFNSKPVITNLTLFAHEHSVRMSGVVAAALEEHLKQCPPAYKLPALYLLDSIAKNIGAPYLTLFTRFIERTFLSAYHVVDPSTQLKMEELLGTWRTGGSDGGELFRLPEEGPRGRVQRGIETALFGDRGRGGGVGGGGRPMGENEVYQAGTQQLPAVATADERSGVLFDIRRLLQKRQEEAVQRPEDEVNQGQINALKQLEALVLNTALTSDQVHQIRGQLAALAPPSPPPVARSPLPPSHQHAGSPPPPDYLLRTTVKTEPMSAQPSIGTPDSLPVPAPAVPAFDPARLAELLSPNRGMTPSEPTPPPPSLPGAGIDLKLLATLQKNGGLAGLFAPAVQAETKPVIAAATTTTAPTVGTTTVLELKKEEEEEQGEDPMVREYEEALLGEAVGLSNKEVASYRPASLSFLYGRLGLQCKQCGLRFFDSPRGKRQMDVHLDWHFTHKRRIREGAGRAQGRSWLGLEEDWIHSDDHLLLDTPTVGGVGGATTSTTKAAQQAASTAAIDRAALMKRKVPAPTDDPVKLAKPCPVCKEKWKAAFEEEEEEWVFWNAVEVDGVLYHATCHAEASASRAAAASTRLRLDNSARASRENTPAGATAGGVGGEGGSAKKRKAPAELNGEEGAEGAGEGEEVEVKVKVEKTDDPRVKRTKSES